MLGNHELRKSSVSGRSFDARVALFALAASGFLAAIGTAQAQDCEGGYRMVKGEIPVACGTGLDTATVAPTAPVREPLHTGSINETGAAPVEHMSGEKCYNGYAYRRTANESYITMPMPCN